MLLNTGLGISGFSVGSVASNGSSMAEVRVGDTRIQFGELRRGSRQVVINGSIHLGVGPGQSTSMNVNDLKIRSSNGELWVNDARVDFDASVDGKLAANIAASGLSELKARYPGVTFMGSGLSAQVDTSVSIAAGAVISLDSDLEIRGNAVIGPTARVSGGKIDSAHIDGDVSGGSFSGGHVRAGAQVTGGICNNVRVESGGAVNGGILDGTTVKGAASGGIISGGIIRPGEHISSGIHYLVSLA